MTWDKHKLIQQCSGINSISSHRIRHVFAAAGDGLIVPESKEQILRGDLVSLRMTPGGTNGGSLEVKVLLLL